MIYFKNWELTADCEVLARQHDNLTRSITVTGDLPPDWTWEMYVSAGGNMDILPMQQDETGISVLLTAQNLPVAGEYTFELHGTQGEKTRSTNSIHVYIPPTMSGDAHWPEIPTAFTELEKRMQALANTYPTIGDNGNWVIADKDTGVSAKGLTPFIGDNGNWWIGEEDTGVPASGGGHGNVFSNDVSAIRVLTRAEYDAAVALEKFRSTITVTVDSGSTVTATLGSTVLTKTSTGTAVFTVGKAGTWEIKATKGDQTTEGTVSITASGQSKSLTLSYANVFGVCWDTSNSSTALTRLTPSTDPYGLVTKSVTTEPVPAVGTGSGSSPFDAYAPWSGMQKTTMDSNVMVFIPVFYVAQKRSGTKQYFYVSDKVKTGFTKHPGSGKYVGRYHMNSSGKSVSGNGPYANITRATARNKAKSLGSKYHLYDFATYCAIIFLYIVEFADWDCQSKIGRGYVSDGNTNITSGFTDGMTYHTGRTSGIDGLTAVQYRWIENLWGNVCQWVDGFNVNSTTAYYCTDPSKYADDTATGYTNIGTLPADGWIKDLTVTDTGLLIPKTTGGSETTYIPDCMWSYSGGWRMLYVGGYWNKGMSAGLLYFEATTTSSNSGTNVSTRLMCEP